MRPRPALIQRTPDGLVSWWTQTTPVVLPRGSEPSPEVVVLTVRRAPFARGDRADDALWLAWERLASATLDADALHAAMVVALETIPSGESPGALPSLPFEAQPPRPTAAHPRAYRGTHEQLPKTSESPLNLRRYVCDRRGLQQLQARLSKHQAAVHGRLVRDGYLLEDRALLDGDPYYIAHHGGPSPPGLPQRVLPLLSQLQGIPWRRIAPLLEAHYRLALDRDEETWRALIELTSARGEHALAWLDAIAAQPAAERAAFTTMLSQLPASARAPTAAEPWLTLAAFDDPKRYRLTAYACLKHEAAGCAPAYVAAGVSLAQRYNEVLSPHVSDQSAGALFRFDQLDGFLRHVEGQLHASGDSLGWEPASLWANERALPGLSLVLGRAEVLALSPSDALELGLMLGKIAWSEQTEPRWRFVRSKLDEIFGLIDATEPRYREKLIGFLEDTIWFSDDPALLPVRWADALRLAARLCVPPFATENMYVDAFLRLIADREAAVKVHAVDDGVLTVLEQGLRVRDTASLVHHGLRCVHATPVWSRLIDRWLPHPAPLLRAMKTLAGLKLGHALDVLASFAAHPLLADDLFARSVGEVCALLASIESSIVPRKLREHVAGLVQLTQGQVARAMRVVEEGLPLAELQLLERMVLEAHHHGLDASDLPPRALQIVREASGNRRAYRNFLRAWARGERDYLSRHERTQAWLRSHPRIDAARLREGLALEVEVDGHGPLRVAIEQDPFEELRLGEYVGSCLQPGGYCTYSAVAVMLDVNKRVIYARAPGGHVVARQIVAVSESDQLVCFEVYPRSTSAALQRHFVEYDEALAKHLGVEVFRGGGADCEIAHVLSREWWDDCAWDLVVEGT